MSASQGDRHGLPLDMANASEPIRYPTHNVVGVLDTFDQVKKVATDLMSQGFMESEINVAQGPVAADRIDTTTGRGGITGLALRIADKLGLQNEEMEFKERYEQAMRSGRFVIRVAAASEERKDRASDILEQYGGHDIVYFGKYTIQRLV